MKNSLYAALLFLGLAVLTACGGETAPEEKFTKEYDLAPFGVMLKVRGPEGLNIHKVTGGILPHEITMQGEEFQVYLYGQGAESEDVKTLKEEQKEETKASKKGFEIISEDDNGYVFSMQYEGDSTKFYNFEYLYIQGDQQFRMTSSTVTRYSQEAIMNMYKAIEQRPSAEK